MLDSKEDRGEAEVIKITNANRARRKVDVLDNLNNSKMIKVSRNSKA